MRTINSLLLISSFFFFSSFSLVQSENEQVSFSKKLNAFSDFRVHRNGQDKMACVWTSSNELGLVKYEVLKTYNEPTDPYAMWEVIATVLPDATRSYKVIDSPVYPGYISYKIKSYYSNSTIIESSTITERINARH